MIDNKKSDAKLMCMLSHFSILLILVIGPGTMAIPLIIWLSERNKENKNIEVEFHARQAFFYQLVAYIAAALIGFIVGVLMVILIGVLLVPIMIIFGLAVVAYGVYGGIQVMQNNEFRYYWIADFLEA